MIAQMLPITALIALGFALRQSGILHPEDGYAMARLTINATLPALIFLSVASANVSPEELALLGLCGASLPIILGLISGGLTRRWKQEQAIAGVIVLGSMIINVGFFLFPFFQVLFGKEGISRLAAFDVGQSILANSLGYYLAISYGKRSGSDARPIWQRLLTLPTLWAGVLGLAANLSHFQLPSFATLILEPLSAANTPLAMLTLGFFVRLSTANWKPMALIVGLRMGVGWLVGQALVTMVGLSGLERTTVSLGASMPIGMIVLTFAATEQLDCELAAGAISLSILAGLVLTPVLLGLYS